MATVKEQLQAVLADADARRLELDDTILNMEARGEDSMFARGMAVGISRVARGVERALESDEMQRLLQLDENGAYYSQRVE